MQGHASYHQYEGQEGHVDRDGHRDLRRGHLLVLSRAARTFSKGRFFPGDVHSLSEASPLFRLNGGCGYQDHVCLELVIARSSGTRTAGQTLAVWVRHVLIR